MPDESAAVHVQRPPQHEGHGQTIKMRAADLNRGVLQVSGRQVNPVQRPHMSARWVPDREVIQGQVLQQARGEEAIEMRAADLNRDVLQVSCRQVNPVQRPQMSARWVPDWEVIQGQVLQQAWQGKDTSKPVEPNDVDRADESGFHAAKCWCPGAGGAAAVNPATYDVGDASNSNATYATPFESNNDAVCVEAEQGQSLA
jgi:hypothetical protein